MSSVKSNPSSGQTDPNIDVTSPYTPRRPSPILSISINHPLGALLRKVKNFFTHKQTLFSTTFTIKVTPIVALVSLLGLALVFGGGITTAFNFGKTVEEKLLASLTPTPASNPSTGPSAVSSGRIGSGQGATAPSPTIKPSSAVIISKTGIIRATYQASSPTPTVIASETKQSSTDNGIASSSTTLRNDALSPTFAPTPSILHYILVEKTGAIDYLTAVNGINLQNYLNHQVLITGSYDSSTHTLHISKSQDVELLN